MPVLLRLLMLLMLRVLLRITLLGRCAGNG